MTEVKWLPLPANIILSDLCRLTHAKQILRKVKIDPKLIS